MDGDAPADAEFARQRLGGVMAASAASLGIGRDEDEWLASVLERVGGHRGRGCGEAPEAPLLPGMD